MSNRKKAVVIGSFQRYGAGKISEGVYQVLNKNLYDVDKIDVKNINFKQYFHLLKVAKNIDLIFYQASIYKFSFVRDIAMLFLHAVTNAKIINMILSELTFGNVFLRSKIICNIFFRKTVITMADLEEFKGKKNIVKIKPNIINSEPEIDLTKKMCMVHVGYIDRIKGWDLFNDLAKKTMEYDFYSLGSYLSHDELEFSKNNKFLESKTTEEIFKNLKMINMSFTPYLIFSSRNDLFPHVIPEMMSIKVPICVFKGSVSEKILMRFCPEGTYLSIDSIEELGYIKNEIIENLVVDAKKFSDTCNVVNFEKSVIKSIELAEKYD